MTYRSLTQHTISCNNIIRSLKELNKSHPKSKHKIRSQIIVNLSQAFLIGGDDEGNLLFSPLHNLCIRKKKIHSSIIRRVYHFKLQSREDVILSCSDDGKISCYEIIEKEGLQFNFLFDIDFEIGINDFSLFTNALFYEKKNEFVVKNNFLNAHKNNLKFFLEEKIIIATFFGIKSFKKELNKSLLKNFPFSTFSLAKINDSIYALGSDNGLSLVEINNNSLSIIKSFDIGTCFKIVMHNDKLYCAANDVFELDLNTHKITKYDLMGYSPEPFLDLVIKRKVSCTDNVISFSDHLMAITELDYVSTKIDSKNFILSNEHKLFCLHNSKTLLRCKGSSFKNFRTLLDLKESVRIKDIEISDKIYIKNEMYSILGRKLEGKHEKVSHKSDYQFESTPTKSYESENLSLFLIDNVLYAFKENELILFTECINFTVLKSTETYFLIERENKKYFLSISLLENSKIKYLKIPMIKMKKLILSI